MSKKENDRVQVLVSAGESGRTNGEVARALGVCVRQVQRLKRALKKEGPADLMHGNRGSIPKHGIPETVYRDRHGIFERNPEEPEEIWEEFEGKRAPTQFGRLMEELGIRPIPANSPQAKGRIERLWGTFQDRLVSELRLAGACTLE